MSMSTAHEPLGMYLHLARASQQRRRPLVRDKMLVLAGSVAAERGLQQVAACCRQRVLDHNPGHLIGQYATIAAALEDERFQTFLKKLRRDFTLEKAEHMLDSLGIQLASERDTYYTDHEYAASLLGISTEDLAHRFGAERELPPASAAAGAIAEPIAATPAGRLFVRSRRLVTVSAAAILLALAIVGAMLWRWSQH